MENLNWKIHCKYKSRNNFQRGNITRPNCLPPKMFIAANCGKLQIFWKICLKLVPFKKLCLANCHFDSICIISTGPIEKLSYRSRAQRIIFRVNEKVIWMKRQISKQSIKTQTSNFWHDQSQFSETEMTG